MVFVSIIAVLVLAAGVAVLAMVATIGVHDALRRFHHDILALDVVFAHVFGARTHAELHKNGSISFFLVAWAMVIAFLVLRQLPSFQAITNNNAIMAAALFGLGLYLSLMLVFLPIFRLGALGLKHHAHVPYWGAFFVAVFVVAASALLTIVL